MTAYKPFKGNFAITSGYGNRAGGFHDGVDFALPMRTPLYAVTDGKILLARRDQFGGLYIDLVMADDNHRARYVHLDTFVAREGQQVKAGDLIGFSGNSGKSTGPHLHFGIITPNGVGSVDPKGIMSIWQELPNNNQINNNQTNNNIDDMATLHQAVNTAITQLQSTNPDAYDNWGRAIGNTDMAKQGKEPLVWVKEMVDQLTWKIQGRDNELRDLDNEIMNLRDQVRDKDGQIQALIDTAPTVRDSPATIKRLDELDRANFELKQQIKKLSEENTLLNEELQKKPSQLSAEINAGAYPQLSTAMAWFKNNITVITTILSGFGLTFSTDSVQQLVSAVIAIIGIVTSFYLEHIYKKTK
jgi:septal ring factor EnvC (AmiA/AmiB activator)